MHVVDSEGQRKESECQALPSAGHAEVEQRDDALLGELKSLQWGLLQGFGR